MMGDESGCVPFTSGLAGLLITALGRLGHSFVMQYSLTSRGK
jgi:hypothetical protein